MTCAEETQNNSGPVNEKSTLRQHVAMHLFSSYILGLISGHVELYKLSTMPGDDFCTPISGTNFQKIEGTGECASFCSLKPIS